METGDWGVWRVEWSSESGESTMENGVESGVDIKVTCTE